LHRSSSLILSEGLRPFSHSSLLLLVAVAGAADRLSSSLCSLLCAQQTDLFIFRFGSNLGSKVTLIIFALQTDH
jgi:hypothetical protein